MIASEAQGFLYCVSSLGVTGVRSEITSDLDGMIEMVRAVSDVPCAIGFGISTAEQAKNMAKKADGVIIGSAIVKVIGEYGADCVPYVGEFLREIRSEMDN